MKNFVLFIFITLLSCSKQESKIEPNIENGKGFIRGVDLSSLPEIRSSDAIFYTREKKAEDVLLTLKEKGVNVIRLKLWHKPENEHASFNEVETFAKEIKRLGLKIWLTVHYSNTWADPGQQAVPVAWRGISFDRLKDSVYVYTRKIIKNIQPDYIQIGNEINSGMLFPDGKIGTDFTSLNALLSEGVRAVRENSSTTQIMIHFAGIEKSDWFFKGIQSLDYDIIALSYYPLWHGKSLDLLSDKMTILTEKFNKPIVIAETAYPFTLKWNDMTNNIVGLNNQLILPEYPANPQGQKEFIMRIKQLVTSQKQGVGFCYWGGELVAFKGDKSKDGSSWENQALYDFNQIALPVMDAFKKE